MDEFIICRVIWYFNFNSSVLVISKYCLDANLAMVRIYSPRDKIDWFIAKYSAKRIHASRVTYLQVSILQTSYSSHFRGILSPYEFTVADAQDTEMTKPHHRKPQKHGNGYDELSNPDSEPLQCWRYFTCCDAWTGYPGLNGDFLLEPRMVEEGTANWSTWRCPRAYRKHLISWALGTILYAHCVPVALPTTYKPSPAYRLSILMSVARSCRKRVGHSFQRKTALWFFNSICSPKQQLEPWLSPQCHDLVWMMCSFALGSWVSHHLVALSYISRYFIVCLLRDQIHG